MQRVEVKFEGDELIISCNPLAQRVDAVINLFVSGAMLFVGSAVATMFRITSKGSLEHGSIGLLLFLLPCILYLFLALISFKNAFSGSKNYINKMTKDWKINNTVVAKTDSVKNLEIKYTGLQSPSRYSLVAQTEDGHIVNLLSTGYTGSRDELFALGQVISDFTNRPDLCIKRD